MSLDSEVPPSKYLSSESRDTTKLLKHLAKKSSSASNHDTSQKFKSIVNNVQSLEKNCQEIFTEVDKKIATILDEAKTKSDEMKEMQKDMYTKLEAITTASEAVTTAQIPNTEKLKEVDVAVIELFKKMACIESIVLNFSKSYYEMDDKDLKNLITKQSIVSVTSSTDDNKTKPLHNPMPIKLTKEQQIKEETPSFSPRKHTIGYEL
jgi:sugar-specific transcriptional regulator TrmB